MSALKKRKWIDFYYNAVDQKLTKLVSKIFRKISGGDIFGDIILGPSRQGGKRRDTENFAKKGLDLARILRQNQTLAHLDLLANCNLVMLKFIYSEKATKFYEISTADLTVTT